MPAATSPFVGGYGATVDEASSDLDRLLRAHQVQELGPTYARLTPGALAGYRRREVGPNYIQLTPRGVVYYTRRGIDEWLRRSGRVPRSS